MIILITVTAATTRMPRLTNAEFADMHFLYGFYSGDSLTAVREYQHRYADQRLPY
jgi:hypothetical protein